MSVRFCECENILQADHTGSTLLFKCQVCHKEYASRPIDTLRWAMETKPDEKDKYGSHLKGAQFDPTIKAVSRKCQYCEFPQLAMTCVGENEFISYICFNCGRTN